MDGSYFIPKISIQTDDPNARAIENGVRPRVILHLRCGTCADERFPVQRHVVVGPLAAFSRVYCGRWEGVHGRGVVVADRGVVLSYTGHVAIGTVEVVTYFIVWDA